MQTNPALVRPMGSHEVRRKGPALAPSPCSVRAEQPRERVAPEYMWQQSQSYRCWRLPFMPPPVACLTTPHWYPRWPREKLQAQPDPNFYKNIIRFPLPSSPSSFSLSFSLSLSHTHNTHTHTHTHLSSPTSSFLSIGFMTFYFFWEQLTPNQRWLSTSGLD